MHADRQRITLQPPSHTIVNTQLQLHFICIIAQVVGNYTRIKLTQPNYLLMQVTTIKAVQVSLKSSI